MKPASIDHISDTAFWVAAYRAGESEKQNPVLRDPLAGKLAGERGRKIAAAMASQDAMAFAIVVRTTAIDRLVADAVARGVDCVINLGAGLDTRPYRMSLPKSLKWVEVDFPELIQFKDETLKAEFPVCSLERIAADLSDPGARRELLARLGRQTPNALVITEGVIIYLTDGQASELSRDLLAVPTFRYWIQDFRQGGLNQRREKKIARGLKRAPFQFTEKDPLRFFGAHGWQVAKTIRIMEEADRIGYPMPFMFPWTLLLKVMPGIIKKQANKTYGYVMFERGKEGASGSSAANSSASSFSSR